MAGQSPKDKVQAVGKNFHELCAGKLSTRKGAFKVRTRLLVGEDGTLQPRKVLGQPCCNTDIAKTCGCSRLKGNFYSCAFKMQR